jgi:hypothetical protein
MNGKHFAAQFKKLVEDAKSHGAQSINCDSLITYIDKIENSPNAELSASDIEKYKAELQQWVETHRQAHEERIEMFRSVVAFGQGAIKSLFLLNAGAVVVLLTFVTHLAGSDSHARVAKVSEFVSCIWPFAQRVMFTAVLAIFAYAAQLLYSYQKRVLVLVGYGFHALCLITAATSLWCFWGGITLTFMAFQAYGSGY